MDSRSLSFLPFPALLSNLVEAIRWQDASNQKPSSQ